MSLLQFIGLSLYTDHVLKIALEAEYAKARARYERWEEEVYLGEEEMPRAARYFRFESARWTALSVARIEPNNRRVSDGLRAYGEKQACLFERMAIQMENVSNKLGICKTGDLNGGQDNVK